MNILIMHIFHRSVTSFVLGPNKVTEHVIFTQIIIK
jgi:hypothetical protein